MLLRNVESAALFARCVDRQIIICHLHILKVENLTLSVDHVELGGSMVETAGCMQS